MVRTLKIGILAAETIGHTNIECTVHRAIAELLDENGD
jgi:hypothetical protein